MLQVVPSVLLFSKKGRNVQGIIPEVRNSLTMNCAVLFFCHLHFRRKNEIKFKCFLYRVETVFQKTIGCDGLQLGFSL